MLYKTTLVMCLVCAMVWSAAAGRLIAEASATAYDTDLCTTDSECEGI